MKPLAYTLGAGLALALIAFVGLIVVGQLRRAYSSGTTAWALVDHAGRPIGAARFGDVGPFSAGLAAVEVDGRWGYVDTEGTVVIAPRFTRAWPFDGSFAVAEDGVDVGVVDRNGRWVIAPAWRRVGRVAQRAVVYGVVGARTSRISGPEAELSAGLVALDGTVVVAPAGVGDPARWLSARGPSEERVAVERADGWHLADLEGNVVTLGLEELYEPHEGLAAAALGGRWGYVDLDGTWVIAPRWSWAGAFSEGRAPVQDTDGWRIVDTSGNVVGDKVFANLQPFREGRAPALDTAGRWGFVDREGDWVVAPQWNRVGDEGYMGGRARVARVAGLDYEWAWVDREGEVVGGWFSGVQPFEGERSFARMPR